MHMSAAKVTVPGAYQERNGPGQNCNKQGMRMLSKTLKAYRCYIIELSTAWLQGNQPSQRTVHAITDRQACLKPEILRPHPSQLI